MVEWLGQNKKRISLYSLIVANILIWSFYFSISQYDLHLKIYDVGQGDSIFLRTAGGYTILIDGGPNAKVAEYLGEDIAFYSRKIDLLILTHPQADHLTGLLEVVKRYRIGTLWISGVNSKTKIYQDWKQILKEKNIEPKIVYQGDKMNFPDGTKIRVLWPRQDLESDDINAYSIVTLVTFGQFDALLTGDADKPNQPYTSSESEVEVFKVPHHGGKNSIEQNYVETISPEVSIISVGKNQSYGHPRGEVINILEQVGSKVYRTDKNGTVEIVSDGRSWYTSTQR